MLERNQESRIRDAHPGRSCGSLAEEERLDKDK